MSVMDAPVHNGGDSPAIFSPVEILAVISHFGAGEAAALLDGSGLSMTDLVDHERRAAIPDCDAVLANARQRVGPSIDIAVGRRLNAQAFGIAGVALLTSPDLMAAIALLQRFWPLFNMRFDLLIGLQKADMLVLELHERPESAGPAAVHDVRLELVKLVTLLGDLLGQDFTPLAGTMVGNAAAHDDLAACLGVALLSAPRASIAISVPTPASPARPQPTSLDAAHRASVKLCEGIMAGLFVEPELIRTIRAKLGTLRDGAPVPRDVAASLGMSERTLRRKLHALGSSYNRILGEVRLDMAEKLLDDSSMTTELIAERLGYTEATNFRHAFRRWTGSSPQRYRAATTRAMAPQHLPA